MAESLLTLVALLFASATDIALRPTLNPSKESLGLAIVLTFVLVGPIVLLIWSRYHPMTKILDLLEPILRPVVEEANLLDLAFLSIAAGVGEELLFRGWLLQWVHADLQVGYLIPILITSIIFGSLHAMTMLYFLVATLIGLIFACQFVYTQDVVGCMLTHALYDFILLLLIKRRWQRSAAELLPPDESAQAPTSEPSTPSPDKPDITE